MAKLNGKWQRDPAHWQRLPELPVNSFFTISTFFLQDLLAFPTPLTAFVKSLQFLHFFMGKLASSPVFEEFCNVLVGGEKIVGPFS